MTHRRLISALALSLCVGAIGCDKEPQQPDIAKQQALDTEGMAWRSLMTALDTAPDDETRVASLEDFISRYPNHPDITTAQKRLDELQNNDEAKRKAALEKAQKAAFEDADATAFVSVVAAVGARRLNPRLLTEDLAKPVVVPTQDGSEEFSKTALVSPTFVRGVVRNTFRVFAKDLMVEERCGRECIDKTVSAVFKEKLGGDIFVGEAQMNPDAVKAFLDSAWADPTASVLGVEASNYYAVFRDTVRAYARVNAAIEKAGAKKAAEGLGAVEASKAKGYYQQWATDNGIAEATGVGPKMAVSFTGWWIRRHADGTAPHFQAYLKKVLDAYDPEFEVE